MPREAITILHLSDMQFGKYHRFSQNHPGTPPNDYDNLTQRLILDLDHLMGKTSAKIKTPIAKPDLIICTGDLAEWGLAKEFTQAFDFLGKVAEHLGLSRDRVVVIPGNHDINRKQCESYFIECAANDEKPLFPWFPKWKQFKAAFDAFYADSSGVTFSPVEPWTLFPIDDLGLVVAGLNSTMDEGHDEAVDALTDTGHHGFCGELQLRWFEERLCSPEFAGWVRVAAVHHNIIRGCRKDNENLRDADSLERILAPHLDLLVHGHTHHAKDALMKPKVPVFSTGSAALLTRGAEAIPTDVPNQYQIITLRRDSITRHCRSYNGSDTPPKWIGDNSLSTDGSDWIIVNKADLAAAKAPFGGAGERNEFDLDYRGLREAIFSSIVSADVFLDQVCRLTELRHERARVEKLHWQYQDMRCLSVSFTTESGIHTCRPVATCLYCPTTEGLDAFHTSIVQHYRSSEPRLMGDCVFGDGAQIPVGVQAHADGLRIRLQRIAQYRGLLDLTDFIKEQTARVAAIQKRAAYRPDWYVNQRMDFEAGYVKDTTADALTQVAGWMQQPGPAFALILGEPGTGKTFLMLELARRLAAVPCMRPILVELRGMEKAKTVAAMLGALFADHKQPSDPKKLNHMVREGAVTLLFDGFDELALRVGYQRAADHLNEIIAAAQGEAPHIVVTSRTSHFESDKQVRNKLAEALQAGVQGLHYCHLLPFEPPQIEAFLQKRFPSEAEDWMRLLRDVEDLIDLSRIPRMLAFITEVSRETLEQARKPGSGTVSAGDVYRLVVEGQWLPFEHQRMNQPGSAELFTVAQMLDAVRHLARALWQTTDKFISLSDLSDHAQRILEKFAPDKVGQEMHATHQLGSGTLLMRDADGRFTFIHQSIMEWLVAEQAAREITQQGYTEMLNHVEMSSLMADFVIDMTGRAAAFLWSVNMQRESAVSNIGDHGKPNALLVLKRCQARFGEVTDHSPANLDDDRFHIRVLEGADLSGRDLTGEKLRGAILADAKLYQANLSGADLEDANLTRADLRSSVLRGANLRACDLNAANLSDADLTGADLRRAYLANANLTRATLIGADLGGAVLTESVWEMARLAGATLDDPQLGGLAAFGAGLPLAPRPPAFLPGASPVRCVAWAPVGDVAATGHENGCIVIWDAHSGKALLTLQGHSNYVRCIAFSPDGLCLASGSADNTIRVWDINSGKSLLTLEGYFGSVWSVAFNPDGSHLASGSGDSSIRLWDAHSGKSLLTLQGHSGSVYCVAFNFDGTRLASGSADHSIRLWDVNSGKPLLTFQGHSNHVRSVVFSLDGSRLASGSADNSIRLWDAHSGKSLLNLQGHSGSVWSVAFSPDGSRLASGSWDKSIRLWDAYSGTHLLTLQGHSDWVYCVAFNFDGTRLASGSADNSIRLWDVNSGKPLLTFQGHSNHVRSVVFSLNGSRLASGSADNSIRLWDVQSGKCHSTLEGHFGYVKSLAFSPDGSRFASGSSDNSVRLWDLPSGICQPAMEGHFGSVRSLAFSPDGSRLASGSGDNSICLWDAASGKCQNTLQGHSGWVMSVAFSSDGSRLASGSYDKSIRLWNVPSGKCQNILHGHSGYIRSVAFSPDGSRLASGSDDNTIRLWNAHSGKSLLIFRGHSEAVTSVAFNRDGTRLASGSGDNTIRLWDAHSGTRQFTLQGHADAVTSVAFWQGRLGGPVLLVSASDDGTIRIWDADAGTCLGILLAHGYGYAALRPDGRYRVVGKMRDYLWHVSGLVRYELGELDEVDPQLKLAEDEPLIPQEYFARQ